MKIELLSPDDITPYVHNPRVHRSAVEHVRRSLEEFGFRQPIVVDQQKVILVGEARWKASKELGLKKIPVHIASDLKPEQARAYRIADNQVGYHSDWNQELLQIELSELLEDKFDLDLLGFDEADLASMLNQDGTEGECDPDQEPEPGEPACSQVGSIYQLGPHRLAVGDSIDQSLVSRLMAGASAHLLLTDPPYNVAYQGKTKDALTIENDSMNNLDFRRFLINAFSSVNHFLFAGATFYIWHADSEGLNFRWACHNVGWNIRQCLIWVKDSMVMGRQDYQWKHEPCLYGWKPGGKHNWYGDRCQTTVLSFPKPKKNNDHPTMKPVALFEYLIRNSSDYGQTVLDPFGGSGTTVIACERTGRNARTVEYDPKYADVIRRRWAEFVYGEGCKWQELTPEEASNNGELEAESEVASTG